MAVPTQAGSPVVIGFGGLAWTGYIAEDGLTWKPGAYDQTEIIKDQNGATYAKIRMDQYAELSGSFIVDNPTPPGTTTIALGIPDEGDVVTITDPAGGTTQKFEVVDASCAMAAGAAKLTVTLRNEVSMTYA